MINFLQRRVFKRPVILVHRDTIDNFVSENGENDTYVLPNNHVDEQEEPINVTSLNIYTLRDLFLKSEKEVQLREHYPDDTKKRYAVTELSDCLFKVFLKRNCRVLKQFGFYNVNTTKINPMLNVHREKGKSIHSYVQERLKQELTNKYGSSITVIMEHYFFDEETRIGGKPDLLIPEVPLLVDIKTGNSNGDTTCYKYQMYLLVWLIRKTMGLRTLDRAYLWYIPDDKIIEFLYDENNMANYLKRIQMLSDLETQFHLKVLRSQDDVIDFFKTNSSSFLTLINKSFCKYCVLDETCNMILSYVDGKAQNGTHCVEDLFTMTLL